MLPDSAAIKSTIRKAIAAVAAVVLLMVLLTALLITGFYLLGGAATLALTPFVGEPGAMAITGLACLCLLALFFYRMTRPAKAFRNTSNNESDGSARSAKSPVAALRSLITRNPMEAVTLAFAVGVAEQSDPRLKGLLFKGGMAMMRQQAGRASPEATDSNETSAPPAAKKAEE
ncbi:MAG: hypothetical protein ACTHYN_02450 [Marinobacter sp.]|uniref:hypothetical protein n=1 Tax=Marinobacter sp. TaxID=50741 RepID=UPI003F9D90C1